MGPQAGRKQEEAEKRGGRWPDWKQKVTVEQGGAVLTVYTELQLVSSTMQGAGPVHEPGRLGASYVTLSKCAVSEVCGMTDQMTNSSSLKKRLPRCR